MNLSQRKLNKSEWNSVEIPVSNDEKNIIQMIIKGFDNPNYSYNNTKTIMNHLKIEYTEVNEQYIYNVYILDKVTQLINEYNLKNMFDKIKNNIEKKKIKSINLMRIDNNKEYIKKNPDEFYEFKLLDLAKKMLKAELNKKYKWCIYYYTLSMLVNYKIYLINNQCLKFIKILLDNYREKIDIMAIIAKSKEYIENNEDLLKYEPNVLYRHQKEIYSIFMENRNISKLVLYTAPTATGKTLTPIGLSEKYRIIFVCAARHVGVALAKSAISVGKKIAFAFGCETADDIRLHYFAAKTYERNRRTGGIFRVDNSDGANVEIMICDIKSYLCAMRYMVSFNDELTQTENDIILFWDEPTITMDYEQHECHEYISKNWNENIIPNIVLSSATLPKKHEISETISDFMCKFENAKIYTISNSECKKSIQMIDSVGKIILPHLNIDSFKDLVESLKYCKENTYMYRYFDLREISKFIVLLHEDDNYSLNEHLNMYNYFTSVHEINMESIKNYYFDILNEIPEDKWSYIYNTFQEMEHIGVYKNTNFLEVSNGMNITTCDSYSLTDGPTIYIAEDVEKIAKYCVQQSKIPQKVTETIYNDIRYNNAINKEIIKLNKRLEDLTQKDLADGNEKKLSRDSNPETKKIRDKINDLDQLYKEITIDNRYIPNKLHHLMKWGSQLKLNSFTSNITNVDVQRIMALDEIEDIWKILLLMGIGLFSKDKPIEYTEIVKEFADEQKLYLIIANGDYIYGTNYQFCHSFIGKDMNITQEKIIQAMGRVGRNKLQQSYTIRLRNDNIINKLLYKEENKKEIVNMNKLFNTIE